MTDRAWIATAGPLAEAMGSYVADDEGLDFEDHLAGALLSGGCDDLDKSLGLLDDPAAYGWLRDHMDRDWPAIEALGARLVAAGTVTGREAWEVLNHG